MNLKLAKRLKRHDSTRLWSQDFKLAVIVTVPKLLLHFRTDICLLKDFRAEQTNFNRQVNTRLHQTRCLVTCQVLKGFGRNLHRAGSPPPSLPPSASSSGSPGRRTTRADPPCS